MRRRTFLQLLAFLPCAPWLSKTPARAEAYDSNAGQWVFDGVHGLTFPATTHKHAPVNAATIARFRAHSFFEQLWEVLR
jgi:hypothetical protein